MKYILILIVTALTYDNAHAQVDMGKMKVYYFVMLTKGPNRGQDSATAANIQKEHLANIKRMSDEGKLVVAGPFMDNAEWRGIYIFDLPDNKAVAALLNSDEAISSGRLKYEIHPWMTEKGTCFK
jgi:uncharacterized protein YciI